MSIDRAFERLGLAESAGAEQFVDEGLFGDIPEQLQAYIDYDAFQNGSMAATRVFRIVIRVCHECWPSGQ